MRRGIKNRMIRQPDHESIPGYHYGAWVEWDYSSATRPEPFSKRVIASSSNVCVTGHPALGDSAAEILLDYADIPALIESLESALSWRDSSVNNSHLSYCAMLQ